ncbi:tetratricopeptide repeat protein [Aliifodinibius sp. S!AR15-10]|uniref:tetratricopeptide repeat protein n=1 Tax=Aliifodinibius sp. S!AR15-10 TaxID=2950437 RepID=UPI0028609F39|nr:tetratricopeptide repeat protein [Aliifodinibius sp. S!AR15-10]MDR8392728.1 tetratricopeptide repeat protein [Aliifodinibius sp. S!AR15-10]
MNNFITSASIFSAQQFLLQLVLCISISSLAHAQNPFEEGKQWYEQRATEADSFRANPKYINNAILAFEEALEKDIYSKKAAAYLLQSYYFKGMFLGMDKDEQKQVYEKGKSLGEQMIERFPDSVPIKFWYAANSGRWADVHGFLAAATNGIAKKLRDVCQDIIAMDEEYQGGGGYRILAQVHFHSPNIPLVMGWPSNDKALELVKKAIEIAPEHPTNLLLYAQILLHFNRNEEALTYLDRIQSLTPRPSNQVEDRYVQHRAQQLKRKHFGGA